MEDIRESVNGKGEAKMIVLLNQQRSRQNK